MAKNKKSVYDLTPEDFRNYPVWEPIDDLEDEKREVMASADAESLDTTGIYFIATQFKLADGSKFDGYIRVSWSEVIELALAINENKFVSFAANIGDVSGKRHEDFADELGRQVGDVFPIIYRTLVQVYLKGETA